VCGVDDGDIDRMLDEFLKFADQCSRYRCRNLLLADDGVVMGWSGSSKPKFSILVFTCSIIN
jgi:hypothetical protein